MLLQVLQTKLKDSSSLIARQADSIALHVRENDTLTSQLRDVSAQLKDVRAELEEQARRLFIEGEAHNSALETWKQEVSGGADPSIRWPFICHFIHVYSRLS